MRGRRHLPKRTIDRKRVRALSRPRCAAWYQGGVIGGLPARRRAAIAAIAAIALAGATGCTRGPSSAELDEWLAEARAADQEALSRQGGDDERAGWTLTVVGQGGASTELRWPSLDRMADTVIDTDLPPEGDVPRHARFRVVTLDELLDLTGGSGGHDEVTLVAFDGFRATIAVADLEAHPIGLAVEANGAPIPRADGGPLFTVLPITGSSLAERYSSSAWVFYVTHVLVDTPPPRVIVTDRRPGRDPSPRSVEARELGSLPVNQVTMSVGYRTGWTSEPVVLEGVLLREILAARGLTLEAGDAVRVTSIAPLTRGEQRPTVLTADEVMLRPTLLATRWAPEGTVHDPDSTVPIPARLGGPLVLAAPAEVQARLGDRVWLTFVDELAVIRAQAAPVEERAEGAPPDEELEP